MPGVVRPYTLVDVLSTIYNQTSTLSQQLNGTAGSIGIIGEADEPITSGDSAVSGVSSNLGWDQGSFNAVSWQ
jgi:hypothetical protein